MVLNKPQGLRCHETPTSQPTNAIYQRYYNYYYHDHHHPIVIY